MFYKSLFINKIIHLFLIVIKYCIKLSEQEYKYKERDKQSQCFVAIDNHVTKQSTEP